MVSGKGKPIRCDVEHCGLPAVSSIELHFLCLPHFITHCSEQLSRLRPLRFQSADAAGSESEDRFLQECAEQAAELVCPLRGFDNLDRTRLFDIFLWAAEISAKRAMFKSNGTEDSQESTGSHGCLPAR